MLDYLQNKIEENSITVITGKSHSGKSWLLSQYSDQSYLIDNRDKAMMTGRGDITVSQFLDAVNPYGKPIVCIDEAQLCAAKEIADIAKLVVARKRKLLITAQNLDSIPVQRVIDNCFRHKRMTICHLELTHWDSTLEQPKLRAEETLWKGELVSRD